MSQSAAVSIKSLLTVGLLAGALIAVVVLLESPGWRGGVDPAGPAGEDGTPGALPLVAGDARPLHGETEPGSEGSDANSSENSGAVLALGLEVSGAGDVVAAVGDAADETSLEEPSALPVFWADAAAAKALHPEREQSDRAEAEPGLLPAEASAESSAASAGEPDRDRFTELEGRLRELGATQYRLETWGAEGELFRFRCWMAISATESHNRFFEATDADALTALRTVLDEVEQWRANQRSRPRRP